MAFVFSITANYKMLLLIILVTGSIHFVNPYNINTSNTDARKIHQISINKTQLYKVTLPPMTPKVNQTPVSTRRGKPTTIDPFHIDMYDPTVRPDPGDIVIALDVPYDMNLDNLPLQYDLFPQQFGMQYAYGAVVAIEDINKRGVLLPNHRLRYVWKNNETDTQCNKMEGIRILLKQLAMKDIHAFLGFTCACETIASIVGALNIPLFSASCHEMDLSKNSEYPTFARTNTLNRDVVHMIIALLRKFKWKKFAVMYEKSHIWDAVYKALQLESDEIPDLEMTVVQGFMLSHDSLEHIFDPFLNRLKTKARIVLLMLDRGALQKFMMLARKRNMTNGDYVFIAVHPFAKNEKLLRNSWSLHDKLWIVPWMVYHGKGYGKEMLKAYQGLFLLMPQIPSVEGNKSSKFADFQNRVRDGMERPPFHSHVYKENESENKSKAIVRDTLPLC